LLLTRSGVAAGERALEVGCGTGAFTVPLAAAVGGRGEVLGADISAAMLASARKRLVEAGLRNVTLTEADAQTHEFEPDRFDLALVCSAYPGSFRRSSSPMSSGVQAGARSDRRTGAALSSYNVRARGKAFRN
jgi:SAM-dependent methyltransferase